MSEIEEINLEHKAQQEKQSRSQNRPRKFIQKRKNSQQQKRENRRGSDQRQMQDRQPKLFEIDIFNFLAKNQVSDLISDIKQRCGELIKLQIVANRIQKNEAETKVILKAFFEDYESAEKCFFQYNDACLDNLVLKTELHIVFYLTVVHSDLKKQQFCITDIYQVWMIVNMMLSGIHLITNKFKILLIFLLQMYMYIYLRNYQSNYVQFSALLAPIAITDQSSVVIILNQIVAFIISDQYSQTQEMLFVLFIALLIIFIYCKQHVEEILTKKKQKVDQDEKFLLELPFPLFIINIKSQIHWSNLMAQELISNCGLNLNGSLKEIFQDQDLFLQYLNQDQKEQIVQMNTILIQQTLQQSQQVQNNGNGQQSQDLKNGTGKIYQSSVIADSLQKSIHKNQNVGCLTLSSFKITEQIQKEILTILIKPFLMNQMKLYLICANTNKSFQQNKVLQNHLIQQIKQNGLQMLVNLQQDYQKWDNMRSLEIIRESDLKVLSQSIVDLYKIIFEFETYEVSTRFFPQQSSMNFQFKSLVIYLVEIFSGRYLQKFTSITLYFDNSIQDKMKGNSANFSLVLMSILELIARFSEGKKPSLKINCNLDQVTDSNKAYQIQLQMLWHQNDELDKIFREFFHQQVMPMDVDPQVQRYLMTIQKLQNYQAMKIHYKEQAIRAIEQLSEIHIFVQFFISDISEEHSSQIYQAPQLQITFCRELVNQNPNEIIWLPKKQPLLITTDKNHNFIIKPSKQIPNFFNKPILPINNEGKQPKKIEEPIQDAAAIQKRNKILKELISTQFSKIAPRLSEKIGILIKQKLQNEANKFEDLQFIEDHNNNDHEIDNEEQSSFCSSDEIKGTSRKSGIEEEQSQATPVLDSVPGVKRYISIPYQQSEFSNSESKTTNQNIQNSDFQIDIYRKLKLDGMIEDLRQNKIDIADFSQITMNETIVLRIVEALEMNTKAKILKFIKCDLSDQLLIRILNALIETNVEILFLQYNLLQEKALSHIINLKQGQRGLKLKELYFNSNLVKDTQISKEKAQLANLGIKIVIG